MTSNCLPKFGATKKIFQIIGQEKEIGALYLLSLPTIDSCQL
jgi:hypothetical protein